MFKTLRALSIKDQADLDRVIPASHTVDGLSLCAGNAAVPPAWTAGRSVTYGKRYCDRSA